MRVHCCVDRSELIMISYSVAYLGIELLWQLKKISMGRKKGIYLDGRLPADNCRPFTIVRDARSEDIVI